MFASLPPGRATVSDLSSEALVPSLVSGASFYLGSELQAAPRSALSLVVCSRSDLAIRSLRLDENLQRSALRRICERVVRIDDVQELEVVRDEAFGIDFVRAHELEEHGRTDGVDQPRRDADVSVPELLEMERNRLPVHADVGDVPAGPDELSAKLERGRNADRLDGGVDAVFAGDLQYRLDGVAVTAVDDVRCAEARRNREALVVQIDHDDLGGRVELGGEQRSEPDRPRSDDRYRAPRRDLTVEDAALETGRQNIAAHDQRLFVLAIENRIESRIRVRDADELGLGAVDRVAEDPPAVHAVREHELATVDARAIRRHAGYHDAISALESGHA